MKHTSGSDGNHHSEKKKWNFIAHFGAWPFMGSQRSSSEGITRRQKPLRLTRSFFFSYIFSSLLKKYVARFFSFLLIFFCLRAEMAHTSKARGKEQPTCRGWWRDGTGKVEGAARTHILRSLQDGERLWGGGGGGGKAKGNVRKGRLKKTYAIQLFTIFISLSLTFLGNPHPLLALPLI